MCHWLTVMAPAQIIDEKDLPPEVLSMQRKSTNATVSIAEKPHGIWADSPVEHENSAKSAATPANASAGIDVHSAPVQGAPASASAAGSSASWERSLEAEALALLQSGRTDVWDVLTKRFESALIHSALATTRGRRIEAAVKLGIGRNTITRKIQELGLDNGE
jgi:two-component system, NtrC family, nitrogen regulation response regulator GlnG